MSTLNAADRDSSATEESLLVAGAVVLLVVAFGCWLAFDASQAKSSLEQARGAAQEARQALLEENAEETG
ncbi:hypothetical protein [Mycolicibacterium tusciae]|uniref:hypothetical protein n=1 Tax=Mycolicibacterium tusciae TaxID=75922 RepID=UPI00024A5072